MPATTALEAGRALLSTMLACSVTITDDPATFLPGLEAEYCFLPDLQPSLTAAWLADAAAKLGQHHVREFVEPLGTAVTLVRIDDALVVIGPYTHASLQAGEGETLLGRLRVPSARLHAFTLYRARFAIVDSEYVVRGATGLLSLTGHDTSDVGSDRVDVAVGPATPGRSEPVHSAALDAIDARYAREAEFMQAIAEGSEHRALSAMQRMQDMPQPPRYFTTPYVGATAMRIMTRIAAQQGGLPPVTIDAISQTYAQQLHRSGYSPDLARTTKALRDMVSEFCLHIRRYRHRPYSGLVRRVMDDVELHLSDTLSPADLASRLGVSESNLARRFKAETGRTISAHVASERASRAAHLLATTNQSVQEVAAYVGYLDANYFVKVFRSVFDMTPTEYRRRSTR